MRLAAIALVAAALAGGCGGGGDDAAPASKTTYQTQGNTICRDAQREVGALPTATPPTLEDLKEKTAAQKRRVRLWTEYSEKVDEIGRKSQDDLLAMTPPQGLRPEHDQLRKDLAQLDKVGAEANAAGNALREAAKTGTAAEIEAARSKAQGIANRQGAIADRIRNDFSALGWTACVGQS